MSPLTCSDGPDSSTRGSRSIAPSWQDFQHFKLFTVITNELSRKSALQHFSTVQHFSPSLMSPWLHNGTQLDTVAWQHKHFQDGGPLTFHLLLVSFDCSSLDGATVDYNCSTSSTDINIPSRPYCNTTQTRDESNSIGFRNSTSPPKDGTKTARPTGQAPVFFWRRAARLPRFL